MVDLDQVVQRLVELAFRVAWQGRIHESHVDSREAAIGDHVQDDVVTRFRWPSAVSDSLDA